MRWNVLQVKCGGRWHGKVEFVCISLHKSPAILDSTKQNFMYDTISSHRHLCIEYVSIIARRGTKI